MSTSVSGSLSSPLDFGRRTENSVKRDFNASKTNRKCEGEGNMSQNIHSGNHAPAVTRLQDSCSDLDSDLEEGALGGKVAFSGWK